MTTTVENSAAPTAAFTLCRYYEDHTVILQSWQATGVEDLVIYLGKPFVDKIVLVGTPETRLSKPQDLPAPACWQHPPGLLTLSTPDQKFCLRNRHWLISTQAVEIFQQHLIAIHGEPDVESVVLMPPDRGAGQAINLHTDER